MVDNLELIKPLITFESEDDFYYLQILQRKKENPQLGSNSRVIKNYYIRSVEYLEGKYEEIKELCIMFNARASLRLNKRSYEKVAFKAMLNMANSMSNREFKFTGKSYDRAIGQNHNDKNKKWILDIDEELTDALALSIAKYMESVEPNIGENKMLCIVPSLNGEHIITKPFNLRDWGEKFPNIEIHKDNPTNLYIP